jgi:predicted Zn-dependent protease
LELLALAAVLGLIGAAAWYGARFLAKAVVEHMPPESERSFGKMAWDSLAPEAARCTNKRTLQYVGDVLRPLLAQQPPGFRFEYTVTEDEELNAFALPGGYITVNMGLLTKIARSEELAGVLAHELAHVTQRHGTRRMATQLGTFALLTWLVGGTDVSGAAHVLASLVSTAYARDQEAEADTVGLRTLTAAHLDPRGMAELFERIAREQPALPELLSTHPDPGERAARARAVPEGIELKPLPPLPEGLSCR